MLIEVKYFGPMTDLTKNDHEQLDVSTIAELKSYLTSHYPESVGITYSISVNEEIVNEDIRFKENDVVAILPPFAGG